MMLLCVGKELRLLDDCILEVDFTDGERRRCDMKTYIPRIPCMQRLVDEEGLFKKGVLSPAGLAVEWDDELDIAIESIYLNGEVI